MAKVRPFSPATCRALGLRRVEVGEGGVRYYLPGSGWYLYDARRADYPWGYAHEGDGWDYGEVESARRALVCIAQTYLSGVNVPAPTL